MPIQKFSIWKFLALITQFPIPWCFLLCLSTLTYVNILKLNDPKLTYCEFCKYRGLFTYYFIPYSYSCCIYSYSQWLGISLSSTAERPSNACLFHLLYTRWFFLIACLTSGVIHGASLSLIVTVLFGNTTIHNI